MGAVQGRARLIFSGRHRARSWKSRALLAITVAALAFSVVTLVVRALPVSNIVTLVIAVAAPYTVFVAAAGLALAVLSRRVLLSVAAVIIVAVSLGIQVRWYHGGSPTDIREHVEVRVLSSNLRYGRADPEEFVDLARSSADVITVTELTAEAVRGLHDAGIHETFPYSILFPAANAGGNGIWSRHPLTPVSPTRYWNSSMVAARVKIPGASGEAVVASVHVTSPMASFESWRNAMVATKSRLEGLVRVESGTVIAAGDFNSTPDMRQFRDLLTNGYRDAASSAGAGLGPTFPSSGAVPPLITIDHVLIRRAEVVSVTAVSVSDTDHRALLATIGIPAVNA